MSLYRKQNSLRKAQARFERVSRRTKQFQIDFRREQTSSDRFRTVGHIVRGEKHYGNDRGILHKTYALRYRVTGDKPSVTRYISGTKPKTVGGKVFKKSAQLINFAVHDVTQTAWDVGLASETAALRTANAVQREARHKLKQKYMSEAVDDYHKGLFFVGKTAVDAVKGIEHHRRDKKRYRLEKARHKLLKAEEALYKTETYKPKKRKLKAERRRYGGNSEKLHEIRLDRKELKQTKRYKAKDRRIQKKIRKNTRTGLLALKPVDYSAKRMKASAWQKAVKEDADNDMIQAVDSAKRRIAEPVSQHMSRPQRLQRAEKKRDKLKDQRLKKKRRLNKQQNRLKSRAAMPQPMSRRRRPRSRRSLSDIVKDILRYVKNVYEKEVKKFFGAIAVPIIVILLVFAFILMIFSGVTSGGGFTLGTYAAQDYDLSEAEKYYTKLAYDMNEKIMKVGDSSDWKSGLKSFGADGGDLTDKPDNWYWGQSDVFDWEPQYDFDVYKLWSFLCAYYYDFDAEDNGDLKYWKFKSETKTLLEELFNAEYEFVYLYDNNSRWEELDSYAYFGGGDSISGTYYYCEASASKSDGSTWTYSFKPTSYTSELGEFLDGDGNCYLNSNYRVLNANDDYALTGYYILDNRYYADSVHTKAPFYWSDGSGGFFFRDHDGNNRNRSFYGWDGDDAWFMITSADARAWTGDSECSALYGYVQKQYWKTECDLYYNVKQLKTFDEVIEEKLNGMSHAEERLAYYSLLIGGEDGNTMYGNHQTLKNMLPGLTIRDYTVKRGFGYEMDGWNSESDGLYQGIKVYSTNGESLYAPFDCEITDVDTADNKITLRKDDVRYWYDGAGGTKRDTEVTIANASLLSGLSEGDTLKSGDEFAKTTAGNVNFHVYIDTDGIGWDYIDPRLVIY